MLATYMWLNYYDVDICTIWFMDQDEDGVTLTVHTEGVIKLEDYLSDLGFEKTTVTSKSTGDEFEVYSRCFDKLGQMSRVMVGFNELCGSCEDLSIMSVRSVSVTGSE